MSQWAMLVVQELTPIFDWSKTFHDVHYVAEKDLVAGEEIFVEYGKFQSITVYPTYLLDSSLTNDNPGDNYFAQRADLQFVPLSTDFEVANRILTRLGSFGGNNFVSQFRCYLWSTEERCVLTFSRLFVIRQHRNPRL